MVMRWMLVLLIVSCFGLSGCGASPPPKSTDTGSSGVSELEPEPDSK